jgi:hypothetical protein
MKLIKTGKLAVATVFILCALTACSNAVVPESGAITLSQPGLSAVKLSASISTADTTPVFSQEIQAQLDAVCDSYYAAQGEPAFEYMQHKNVLRFLAQWVGHRTDITEPQWNFDSFTRYQVLNHNWEPATREGQDLYYCTFSDGVRRYGFAAFAYNGANPSISNYSIAETDSQLFDLRAVMDDIASNLIKTGLDLSTTIAERVAWLDKENNRTDPIILFTDMNGAGYYYFLGDTAYEIHKVN